MNLLLCSQTITFKHKINNRINDTLVSEFVSDNLTKTAKVKKIGQISNFVPALVLDRDNDNSLQTNCIFCSCDWPLKASSL